MFRLFIQDLEEIVDIHATVLLAIHNLDRDDEVRATKGIQKSLKRVFDTEGFGTWPKLHPFYQRWKEREYPGKTILRMEDNYYKAATQYGHPGNLLERSGSSATDPESRETTKYSSITYGLNEDWFQSNFGVFYPKLHEEEGGTNIYAPWLEAGSYHIPERQVFGLAEDDARLKSEILKAYRFNMIDKLNSLKGKTHRFKGRQKVSKAQKTALLAGIGKFKVENNLPF